MPILYKSCLTLMLSALLWLSTSYSPAAAQSFNGFGPALQQNGPPKTELIVARLRFGTNGRIGHRGWSHNYPGSDRHLNSFLERSTLVNVHELSYLIMDLDNDELFKFPFVYLSEPGEMLLSDQEVINLREYILRGGTIIMDDFDGVWQWDQMESQIRRAFPDRAFIPVNENHVIYSAHENLENLQAMSQHVPGGSITYYGLFTDDGRLAIMAGHNNDLANFWEWYGNGSMPLKPSTDAFRLGTNVVIYSMTH